MFSYNGDSTVALAAIGLVATIMIFVVKPLFNLLKNNTRATNKLIDGLDKVAKSNKEIANAGLQGNKEAKARNGHLAELIVQQGDQTKMLAEAATKNIISGIQNIEHQHIKESHIQNEIVEHETVKEAKIKE